MPDGYGAGASDFECLGDVGGGWRGNGAVFTGVCESDAECGGVSVSLLCCKVRWCAWAICSIEEGAVVRDSIIMNNSVIGKNTIVNKSIIAEEVVIGDNVELGVGEEVPNVKLPKIYNSGLVTIGECSVVPDGVKVGKNTAISGVTTVEDYPDGLLPSGGIIIKAGEVE